MKRKTILLAVICAMFSITAFGQQLQSNVSASSRDKDAVKLTDDLKKELKLTDAQYKKLLEVNVQSFKNQATDVAATTKKAAERDKKYKEILTAEQYSTYQKSMKKKVDATFESVKKGDEVKKPTDPTPKPAPAPAKKDDAKPGTVKKQ